MSKAQLYREIAQYFPRESKVSTPPLATQGGGGGFVVLSAGTASVAGNMFTFSDGNGVSFGMDAGVITASAQSFSQSVQTQSMVSINGSTGSIVFSNSNNVTFGGNNGTITASFSQSQQPIYFVAQGGTSTVTSLRFNNGNGVTFLNSNGSVMASINTTGATSSATLSAANKSEIFSGIWFTNSNGISFGLTGGTISASYTVPSDYISTNQSSLLQHTSAMSNYIGSAYTSHTHAQYLNTSQSSVFIHTSASSNFIGSAYTSHTHSQYLNTSVSSNFQQSSQMSDYLQTGYTSHTHSQYINTSVSSNFQQSSLMSNYLGTGYTTHTHSQSNPALSGSNGSFTYQTATFGNLNGLSFYTSNGSIVGSYTTPTQTAHTFSNSNNVSFGTAGSIVTASASFSQTNQTVGVYFSSQTTGQSSSYTADARSLSVRGMGNISVGMSGNQIIVSGSGGGGGDLNISAGTTSNNLTNVVFSNSNNISFGLNGSTITAAGPAVSSLVGTGAVSISTNGSTISIGAPVQSNQNLSLYAAGNTTQNSSTVINASNFSIRGLGNISVGFSNGTIQISGSGGGGAGSLNISAGTTSNNLTNVVFSNSNNISFGLNGSTLTASGPALSTLVGVGGINVSSSGSTISISGGGMTYTHFSPYANNIWASTVHGNGTVHVNPVSFPNVSFDNICFPMYFTNATNATGTITASVSIGVYSYNAGTLSLYTSFSGSNTLAFSGTVRHSVNTGVRHFVISAGTTISQGLYYVGIGTQTTFGGGNATLAHMAISQLASTFRGFWGDPAAATAQYEPGIGYISGALSAIPASVAFSHINGTAPGAQKGPIFYVIKT